MNIIKRVKKSKIVLNQELEETLKNEREKTWK